MSGQKGDIPERQPFVRHPRQWRDNVYVYPVMSRRARGLSVGINLSPDKGCNFNCIYCQVDRITPPAVQTVDLPILARELEAMLDWARTGEIFDEPAFARAPQSFKRLNDVAFSGDGEPTACPQFPEAIRLAAGIKSRLGLDAVKLICITNTGFFHRPRVREALALMDRHQGEIWAKLDAGTEGYYRQVNRPNYPLGHVLDNILDAARVRPVVIQSLWMRVQGEWPSDAEVGAFCDRLAEMQAAGGWFALVQVYTIARRPAEAYVGPLTQVEVDAIAETVRERTGLPTEVYYGAGD